MRRRDLLRGFVGAAVAAIGGPVLGGGRDRLAGPTGAPPAALWRSGTVAIGIDHALSVKVHNPADREAVILLAYSGGAWQIVGERWGPDDER